MNPTLKIKITKSEHNDRGAGLVFMLSLLLAGVLGLMLWFGSFGGIVFHWYIVYPAAILWCALIVYMYFYKRNCFFRFALIILILSGTAVILKFNMISAQAIYAAKVLAGKPPAEPPSVTFLTLAALPTIALLLFLALTMPKSGVLLCLGALTLILTAPLLGLRKCGAAILVLSLFVILSQAQSHGFAPRRGVRLSGSKRRAAALSAASACAISAIITAAAAPAVYTGMDRLSELTCAAEGNIYRAIIKYTGKNTDVVQSAVLSRFNNYLTNREQLIVQITGEPREPLYLKGFVGGDYHKSEWEAADDTSLLSDIQNKYRNNWGILGITNTYSNLYFTMNSNTLDDAIPSPGSMSVRYISSEGKNYYVPYYSQVDTIYVFGGYRFRYYEKCDMRINWNNVPPMFERKRDQCLNLQTAYMSEASEAYTHVPVKEVPRLAKLCGEQYFDSLSEITDFIKNTLDERTEYTLTPGWSSMSGDVVEEFLFDRGKGYCVHYAAAATLMYRMFGVPARYVTGYMIPPSDFERQKYGTYSAALKDKNSHAWVEIFLRDYGWTPVEFTPTVETAGEIYPGYSIPEKAEQDEGINLNINLIPKNRSDADEQEAAAEDATQATENAEEEIADYTIYERSERPIRIVFGIILALIAGALGTLLTARGIQRRMNINCRTEFGRMIDALHAGGLLKEYDGTEPDFGEKLIKALPDIDNESLRVAVDTVSAAAYGPGEIGFEENRLAAASCRKAAKAVLKTLPIWKKIIFKIKEFV